MDKLITVTQVVAPIFAAVILGMLAKRKALVTQEGVAGFQQFVMKFGLPCVVFNSCLTAQMGAESISSMALILPALFLTTLWSFWARKKKLPYRNLPMLFAAQESGMLGIPLTMILFGTGQAYRMGVLDLTQSIIALPVIALLSSAAEEEPNAGTIVKNVLTSPLLLMSLLGLSLNLLGIRDCLEELGLLGILTDSTEFIGQPVSALMIFSVGYNFSLNAEKMAAVTKVFLLHFAMFTGICLLIQAVFFLIPDVDALTRWTVLLYCMLPSSYLAPGLGQSEDDYAVASGVCSIGTLSCMAVFCIMAAVAV